MASLPLPQSNYPDESDIADSHHELNSDEEDLPPRPNSRLGFNSVPTEVVAPKVPAAPARSRKPSLKWTRSLFQKIGIPSLTSSSSSSSAADVDMDITAAPIILPSAEDDEDLDPVSLPILPSLSSAAASTSSLNLTDMDVDTGSSCDDEFDDSDSDGYSSEDSDIDLDSPTEYGQGGRDSLLFPPAQPLPSPPLSTMPPSSPPAVPPAPIGSLMLPPAPRTPAPLPPIPRRTTPASLPPLRTKYSCLPSPLSPAFDSHISYTNPLRHAYGHHGRSRHALLHLKYLWAIREDQWDAHTMRMRDAYAYEGVSPASLTLDTMPPPRHSSASPPPPPQAQNPDYSQSYVPLPPMTIHPRRGDLSALRDPYCAHMDRCFVGMPLWTMGKTLWMYDVHVLAGHRERMRLGLVYPLEEKLIPDGTSEDEESGSEGENSMMASSVSTAGFSDDSDETLVESERSCSEDEGIMEDVDLNSDTEKVEPHLCSRLLDDYRNSKHGALMLCASPKSSVSLPPPPRWETCWYKRYDILLELLRLDKDRELAPQQQQQHSTRDSTEGPPRSGLVVSVCPPRSRFFIGDEDGDEDWDGGEGDESWSEERWDRVLAMDRAAAEDDDDDVMIVSNQIVVH